MVKQTHVFVSSHYTELNQNYFNFTGVWGRKGQSNMWIGDAINNERNLFHQASEKNLKVAKLFPTQGH